MNLKELKINNSGVITKLEATGQLKQRLLDMGITKGTRITVVKVAPLGDPIECIIRGYNLSVRKADAENIIIDENTIEVVNFIEQKDTTAKKEKAKSEKKSFFSRFKKEDK